LQFDIPEQLRQHSTCQKQEAFTASEGRREFPKYQSAG